MSKLTGKQERFCREYLKDGKFNATRAAEAAGYSKKTAYSIGNENLKKPEIIKRLEQLQKKTNNKYDVSAERVVAELAKIGFSDEFGLEGFERLDLKDKIKALEMLARHVGAFNKDESNKATIKVSIKKPGE